MPVGGNSEWRGFSCLKPLLGGFESLSSQAFVHEARAVCAANPRSSVHEQASRTCVCGQRLRESESPDTGECSPLVFSGCSVPGDF
jgi:hypothetical protein